MSTNTALFNKEKMIFYTANAFIQDLIHDMLKLADRPKGAFNASARVVQNWLSTKIVADGAKSPTSGQKTKFFRGGKPKIRMSGGGPELLKEAVEAYNNNTGIFSCFSEDGNGDELFFELMETLITYNLLIQLNGQVDGVEPNPVFFTTEATLTAAEHKCYSFETLIIDFEKVRELNDEWTSHYNEGTQRTFYRNERTGVPQYAKPIVQYEGGIFFHGKIYENVQVQYFNKNSLFYEEYDTILDSRIQSCWPPIKIEGGKPLSESSRRDRWEAVNTNIRLFIQLEELGVIIIYPYKAMRSKAYGLPDIQLVWYGTDGELFQMHNYNAYSANHLFKFSPTGHQYATTMMSCNAQQQLSDWLIFNYAPENIREQLFGYNFYVNNKTTEKKLKVIDINEGPGGNVVSIEAMDEGGKIIETFPIGKFGEEEISLTNSLGEKINRDGSEEEEEEDDDDAMEIEDGDRFEGRSPVANSYIDYTTGELKAEDEDVVTNSVEQGGGGETIPQLASVSITWMVLIGVQVFNTPLSQYIRNFKASVINKTTDLKWENTLAKLQYEHLWPYMSIRELTTGAEAQSFGWQKRIKPTGPINLKAANNSAFDSDFMKAFKKFMRDPDRRDEGLKGIFGSCDDAKNKPVCTYIADKGKRRMGGRAGSKSGGIETTKDTIWEVMKRNNDCFPSEDNQEWKPEWVARGNYFTSGERKTDKYLINNAIGISARGRSLPYLDNMNNNWFCPITSSIDPQATCKMTDDKPLEWNSYKSAMEWGKMDVTVGISGESTNLARDNCSLKYRITLEPNFTSIDPVTGNVFNAQGDGVSQPQVSHKKELKIGQEILLGKVGSSDNSEFTIKLGDDVSKETDAKNSLLKLISTTTLLLGKDIKGYMGLMKKIKIPLIQPKYYYVAANPAQNPAVGAEEVTLIQAYKSPFGGIHAMRRDFPLLKGGEVKKITKSASKGIDPSLFFIDNHLQKNDRVIKIEIDDDIPVNRVKLQAMKVALQEQVEFARLINFGSKSKEEYLDFVCVFNIENGKIGLVPHDSISNSSQKFPKNDIWTKDEGEKAYNIRRTIAAAASTKLTGDQIQEFGGVMSNGGYVGAIYKAGENLPIYSGRGNNKKQVGVTPSILPPDQGRVMLGNDQPSSIRAMVMALYAQGDINKKSIVGYMPVDGYFVVASPNGGNWTSAGGGTKRKKRKKKKTKKRKTKKRKRKKIKTRRRNKKRGTKKKNKKRRVTRHKK